MQHTLSILVENRAGVLSRVAGLFSRRGFNIESLVVGITQDPAVSRITIVTSGEDDSVEQIEKQLHKLPDVLMVRDLKQSSFFSRQLILIKVRSDASNRSEIMQVVDVFRAHVVDISLTTATIELTGTDEKIQAILQLLEPYGIMEVVRTGSIAIERGEEHMSF
ncbi:MAG: acetolactate synthase small subunit [Eubacteriales bacterium]|jgi:acetolactate synthase-1/3 small subunit|nr:acetolactate synthase small subunit [Eubacteriales bacterium]MDD4327347.1 acetolactate synthase small subunit [Eubacteriales bacterium]NCU26787.1 acetolactate synthase small subunit [Candidatus Nomurabacteria bacterium]